ncbi:FecR domain-containing protein [Flammeovirgaceae bacterium SG7u.111]|nr:FecR domain-containing protein [Flammeovirgaceae bacterium SG7u.132]WPO34902.1 FecR domain-containing protein [Flammeovirgaceae bacterium SG7u.111]
MDIELIIGKVLQGEANDDERAVLDSWLKADKANQKFFETLKNYWTAESVHQQKDNHAAERRWEKTLGKIHEMGDGDDIFFFEGKPQAKEGKYISLPVSHFYKIAVAAVLVVAFGLLAIFASTNYFSSGNDTPIASVGLETKFIEKHAGLGEKKLITLPDGTSIKLNSGSTLFVSEEFGVDKREIRLEGEAFFDVAKDSSKPFVIRTEGFDVTVLGTSFNVSAYKDQPDRSVVVVEGKVKVGKTQGREVEEAVFLTKGQMVLDADSLVLQEYDADLLAWKDNILLFDTHDFAEIKRQIEKWYGVKVILKRQVDLGKGFKGHYENESLENVLENLKYALSIEYTYKPSSKEVLIW